MMDYKYITTERELKPYFGKTLYSNKGKLPSEKFNPFKIKLVVKKYEGHENDIIFILHNSNRIIQDTSWTQTLKKYPNYKYAWAWQYKDNISLHELEKCKLVSPKLFLRNRIISDHAFNSK